MAVSENLFVLVASSDVPETLLDHLNADGAELIRFGLAVAPQTEVQARRVVKDHQGMRGRRSPPDLPVARWCAFTAVVMRPRSGADCIS